MVRHITNSGSISVSDNVYTNIAGIATTNCFGVKGMAIRSMKDGLVHLLKKEALNKGVLVTFHPDGAISIDLHIIVDHGVNIPAVSDAITSQVRYTVTKTTGTEVRAVNIFVDSIMN